MATTSFSGPRRDAERIAEFIKAALWNARVIASNNPIDLASYLADLSDVISAWVRRAGEIGQNPTRFILVRQPFEAQKRKAREFIEKYDIQVSFREDLKSW